jgi:polar amino acid transport system substrate-binding protein
MAIRYLLVLALSLAAGAHADTITIRADEWLPYNGTTARKPPGYMIEMADAIAKANGHTINYSNLPWDDAVDAVRKGTYDCVVGALKSDAEGFAFPSEPWGKSQNAFYARKGSTWRYEGPASLDKVRLAVIDGYSYGDDVDAYVEQHKADPARIKMVKSVGRARVQAFMHLVTERADVFVEDVNVAGQTIDKLGIAESVEQVGVVAAAEPLYVACTPADPRGRRYATMFSEGTKKLRQSGELARILQKYGVQDWKAAL